MTDLKINEMFCRPTDERALLAYCLKDINYYYDICSKLEPNDFLYDQHSTLMSIFGQLVTQKGATKLDPNLVIAEAQAHGVLESIGGLKYVQTLGGVRVSKRNFDIHRSSVMEAATKCKLYYVLQDNMISLAEQAKGDVASKELVSKAEGSLLDLSMRNFNGDEPKNLADGFLELIEERRKELITVSGMSTGYAILDKQIDGMVPGTLLIIAARKKMGKSAFLTNIATNVAYQQRKSVLYVDTELSFKEWRDRAIAKIANVDEREFKHGGYSEETYRKLIKANEIIQQGKLFHEYMPGYSVDRLVSLYNKYKIKEDISLIVFDYLKEPESTGADKQRKEYQILGDVTTKLKDLSGKLNIPALTAVQLNRDNDIADSDRIARYGDVICHWGTRTDEEREEGGPCGTHKLVIRDSRRGGTTNEHGIGFNFWKEKLKIGEVRPDKQYFANFDNIVNNDSCGSFEEEDDAL